MVFIDPIHVNVNVHVNVNAFPGQSLACSFNDLVGRWLA